MADESKKTDPDPSNPGSSPLRREPRHPVPPVYQRYIDLKVEINDVFVPVILHNFSGSGVLFASQVPCEVGSRADCIFSISQSLSRDIAFAVRIKHCREKNSIFLVGATIETAVDATWFRIFTEVHNFIMQRQGDVY